MVTWLLVCLTLLLDYLELLGYFGTLLLLSYLVACFTWIACVNLVIELLVCLVTWLQGYFFAWSFDCLVTWLLGCLVVWLAWLLGCLVSYLVSCLVAWLLGYLDAWLFLVVFYLVTWLLGCLVTWLLGYLVFCLLGF